MMTGTQVEHELRLIRLRLEAIEDALAEEMTDDDKRAHREAIEEHRQGKSIPFTKVRKR